MATGLKSSPVQQQGYGQIMEQIVQVRTYIEFGVLLYDTLGLVK